MSNFEPPAPPPPPGGYGAPPPPPAGGYGGPPPGGPDGWDVGAAVNYGWTKFQANVGQMILAALAIFAGVVVIYGVALVAIILPGWTGPERTVEAACDEAQRLGYQVEIVIGVDEDPAALSRLADDILGRGQVDGVLSVTPLTVKPGGVVVQEMSNR